MINYNIAKGRLTELLGNNRVFVGVWAEFFKIIDELEESEEWQRISPTHPPAISWDHALLIRNNAEVVCFLARITESDTEDNKEDWFLSDHTALSDLLDFYYGCSYKLVKL